MWFDVDKDGLAKLLQRKGKASAIFELVQNAWDTDAAMIHVGINPIANSPFVIVRVIDDDPKGFSKLEHAFTLFAESDKKSDPTKRGRFNLGEKLVLALCRTAEIASTTGTIKFDDDGNRRRSSVKTVEGSEFEGEMRMTRDEMAEVLAALQTLIPPEYKSKTFINGEQLMPRSIVREIEAVLPTEIADAEGYLHKTLRKTLVKLYDVREGEKAYLYEMGIPVVELPGDRWHVNVGQKIPLNMDRDNVTPAYLRDLRVVVLNHTFDLISADNSKESWVRDAAGDQLASTEAIDRVLTLRFGEKRVIADPSDLEGTKIAMSEGYTVIQGGALSAGEWKNVHRTGAALPAGQVTPSPKPYTAGGRPEKIIPEVDWSTDVRRFVKEAKAFGRVLIGVDVDVRIVNEPSAYWRANYGKVSVHQGRLALNVAKLGRAFFKPDSHVVQETQISLLLHEFAHHMEADHLSSNYYRTLTDLGARLAMKVQGFSKYQGRYDGSFAVLAWMRLANESTLVLQGNVEGSPQHERLFLRG